MQFAVTFPGPRPKTFATIYEVAMRVSPAPILSENVFAKAPLWGVLLPSWHSELDYQVSYPWIPTPKSQRPHFPCRLTSRAQSKRLLYFQLGSGGG